MTTPSRSATWTTVGVLLGLVLAVVLIAGARRRGARRVERSRRPEQETREDESVVDEWGRESFPASDPPQSW